MRGFLVVQGVALIMVFLFFSAGLSAGAEADEMPVEVLADKIRGGLLGQILGNLNGLPHENKYYDEPGDVQEYTPALPQGARTDDDTDIEWLYVTAMQKDDTVMLSAGQIVDLWQEHINTGIWCSNRYVRYLMDLGIEPPLTGNSALNPWANFNISGQFICESFGLIAPAMPQAAARIGLNYTHVTIDGEPAQTTQLFTAMIATAFVTDDIDEIIDVGLASIDANSMLGPIVRDVRLLTKENPDNWRRTRRLIRDKYTLYESRTRNENGYELCTAATIAALLYGQGDFVETLRHAFNFGWDADNNAATAGTVVGVIKGYKWMRRQGWDIKDIYRNTTRPKMPTDETITGFADRLVDLAGLVIVENGGEQVNRNGEMIWRITHQQPANVEPLTDRQSNLEDLRATLAVRIEAGLAEDAADSDKAAVAYIAICLGLTDSLRARRADGWADALAVLNSRQDFLRFLFYDSPGPVAEKLQKAASAAGVKRPVRRQESVD